jgi:hypothetical protein
MLRVNKGAQARTGSVLGGGIDNAANIKALRCRFSDNGGLHIIGRGQA